MEGPSRAESRRPPSSRRDLGLWAIDESRDEGGGVGRFDSGR